MTRGRVIAHRLYLSAMVVLVIFGVGVVTYAVLAFFHDERVTREDRECFESRRTAEFERAVDAAPDLRKAFEALPPLPPGAKLDPPDKKPLRRKISAAEATKRGFVPVQDEPLPPPGFKPLPNGWVLEAQNQKPLRRITADEATRLGAVPIKPSQDFDPDAYLAKAKSGSHNWREGAVVVPPPPPGFVIDQPKPSQDFDPDAYLANRAMEDECNFSTEYHPEGRSSRAWLNLTKPETALSVLAFIPAIVLWALARWVRWIFKPVAA